MKLSRRTNTIVLWVIAVALLVGMIVMFTPTMGDLGGARADSSTPALLVNGEPINELEIARAQQGALYSRVREGEAAQDLELLLLDQLIQQEVLAQAASRVNVSGGEVREAVNEFREQNSVAGRNNDQAYLNLIGRVGFTDASFRDYIREQLRLEKYQTQLTEDVTVSEAEVEAFYDLNQDDYRTDERILARMIVVDDAELAADLRQQAVEGADFSALANEHSLERADRAGALGAPADSTEPQPVGRAALPTQVATAAFGLQGSGVTEVVEAGSRYYVVQVNEHLPADVQPLEEVRAEVEEDALAAKQGRVLEDHIAELRADASIAAAEGSEYAFQNDVVARVGDNQIMETDLVRATYTNPQIQQALGPENADLIAQFFKPTILSQLIDREVAYLGAQDLDASFVGPKALVAQEALAWVSRDVTASEEELRTYYDANQARFTVPAEAEATRVTFDALEPAEDFRSALLAGAGVQPAAGEFGGDLEELGTVFEGDLQQALDAALFGTEAFEPLPESEREVSDVLVIEEAAPEAEQDAAAGEGEGEEPADEAEEGVAQEDAEAAEGAGSAADDAASQDDAAQDAAGSEVAAEDDEAAGDDAAGEEAPTEEAATEEGATEEAAAPSTVERFVVLVADRTASFVRPFEEVRAQVEQAVLSQKRAEAQAAWLESLREEITVVNLLSQVEPDTGENAPAEGAAASGEADVGAGEGEAATEPAGDPATVDAPSQPAEGAGEDVAPTTPEDGGADAADPAAGDAAGAEAEEGAAAE